MTLQRVAIHRELKMGHWRSGSWEKARVTKGAGNSPCAAVRADRWREAGTLFVGRLDILRGSEDLAVQCIARGHAGGHVTDIHSHPREDCISECTRPRGTRDGVTEVQNNARENKIDSMRSSYERLF